MTTDLDTATEPETTWTFDIPEVNAESVRAKIGALQRRAIKLGIAVPTITEGEPKDVERRTERGTKYIERYIPFTVTQVEPIKFSGWTFAGTIEHGWDEDGKGMNLLRMAPSFTGETPKSYRTDAPTCDHCQTSRRRTETFVVHHEDGQLKRVGRQCLADYLGGKEGKDILSAARWFRSLRTAFEDEMGSCGFGGGVWRVGILDALIWTATTVRTSGWLSRTAAREQGRETATADIAWNNVTRAVGLRRPTKGEEPLPEVAEQDRKDAAEALEWARNIDEDTDSDYLHNLRVICSRGSCSAKEVGLAASAVATYIRERDRAIAMRIRMSKPSNFMGEVGQRFGGKGKTGIPAIEANVVRRSHYEGMYGVTTIIVVQTDEGNELVSFNTGYVSDDIQVGKRVSVVGTIKAHKVNDKTKRNETVINRTEFTVVGDAPAVELVAVPVAASVVETAPAATEVAPEPEVKPEPQPEAPVAQEPTRGCLTAIVLTAKTVTGETFTAVYGDAASAVQAGVDGRANGTLDWRTIRYTLNGEKVATPELRKLARV